MPPVQPRSGLVRPQDMETLRRATPRTRVLARASLGLTLLTAAACSASFGSGASDYRAEPAGPTPSAPSTPPAEPTPSSPTPTPTPSPSTPSAPAAAVPWERIDAFHRSDRGTYTEAIELIEDDGDTETMIDETGRFDLAASYMERSIRYPSDELDPDSTYTLLYAEGTILLGHPDLPEACGAEWVEVTTANSEAVLGYTARPADLLAVVPLDALDWVRGEPVHVATTAAGSTYEVTVPADVVVTLSSDTMSDSEVRAALADIEVTAEVLLPPEGGALGFTVDLTEAHRAMDFPADLGPGDIVRTSWTVTPDIPAFDTAAPTDVTDAGCLDLQSET